MPLLCIDIGNTHTHYGVVGIDTTTDLGEVKTATLDDPLTGLAGVLRALARSRPEIAGIAFCSVVPAASPRLRDLMVTFATAPGKVALDRSTRVASHSPFTAALLKALKVPQLRLLDLNPMVTDEVEADSGGKQRPHVGGSYGVEAGNLVLLG